MYLNKDEPSLKQYIAYSILVHAVIFVLGSISFFIPKKDSLILENIEIASEGELQDILNNQKEHSNIPEIEQKPILEDQAKETNSQEKNLPSVTEEKDIPEDNEEQEKSPIEKEQEHVEPVENKKPKIENIKEEPVPKLKDKKPENSAASKPKKRDRKAFLETINKAEKKKARENNRKKILAIAEKASKKNNTFDKMLNGSINDLEKITGKGKKGNGVGSFGTGSALTETDYEVISSQIYPHWVVPSGVREAENIVIEIAVKLKDNGEVISSSIKILDAKRYAIDYIFRAAADSARRAILEASPLRIPKDKIGLFKDFILRFNLKEALGG